jgi:hypothetical protein
MVIKEEDGVFDLIGNHVSLTILHKSLRISNPDVNPMTSLAYFIFPFLPRTILHRVHPGRRFDHRAKLLPVFKGELTIDPMPRSMKSYLDRLLDDERRIPIDHDIGVVSVDGEILGKRRGNEEDEGEVKAEESKPDRPE